MSGFLWGAATAGHQIEGGNVHSDWWHWEQTGYCEGGARSGIATDHWNRFREDLGLAREMGLTSYRFSVEWSRLEPEQGRWSAEAFDRYDAIVGECERLGLVPMLTLQHFTLPQWLAERGGLTWMGMPRLFRGMTRQVVERLGARVPLWCPINEPVVLAAGSYIARIMPPAKYSPLHATQALANLLRSQVAAYELIHRELPDRRRGPTRELPLAVGVAHNVLDFVPDRSWHPLERYLARVFTRFYNRSWIDAVCGRRPRLGVVGLIPEMEAVPEALGRVSADFIGINYYTKAYVQWRPRAAASERPSELPLGLVFARRRERASDVEWAIHPAGLGKLLRWAASYRLPLYITENGIADREDRERPHYLLSHLLEVARARAQGIDVRGYYHWSLIDNFEWIKGFGPRFGLIRVNYEDLSRHRTRSAEVLTHLIQDHQESGGADHGPSVALIERALAQLGG